MSYQTQRKYLKSALRMKNMSERAQAATNFFELKTLTVWLSRNTVQIQGPTFSFFLFFWIVSIYILHEFSRLIHTRFPLIWNREVNQVYKVLSNVWHAHYFYISLVYLKLFILLPAEMVRKIGKRILIKYQ